MTLDVNTLFFLTMYVEAILGLLLFLAWAQNLGMQAMAWWGGAHLLRSLSAALYGMYGAVPNFISIDIAGALLFTSYGVTWTGARVFSGRAPQPLMLLSGALAWVLCSQFVGSAESNGIRYLLSSAIIAGFSWAAAFEFWRGRHEGLVSRWPAIVLLFAQGVLFLLRTPLSSLLPHTPKGSELSSAWLTVLSPEVLLFTISSAFILLAMGKERAELGHKNASLLDPLTGLSNRRGFMQDAEVAARIQLQRGRPVAVFLIDMDHFKSINDRFGHAVGDRVLRLFGDVCREKLRATDFVGRIGGEEFAVMLPNATRDNAYVIAERIRAAFEFAGAAIDGEPLAATLSIGVAIAQDDPEQDLGALLKQADQAVYRAKHRGRNRVELAPLDAAEGLSALPEAAARATVRSST